MRTVILCGGQGTRAWPATAEVPKPMLRVGDRPVLHHVMEIYAEQGWTDFLLATGYRGDVIESWAAQLSVDWKIECLDTGEQADTGDRLGACAELIGSTFFATYGDGLGNVDLAGLLGFHRRHGGEATITTVPLPSPFGTIESDSTGRVTEFKEKPALDDHWINAGFMIVEPQALRDKSLHSLEVDVLPDIGRRGQLFAYRHDGFWKSMDTHKDVVELNQLAQREGHPWLRPRS